MLLVCNYNVDLFVPQIRVIHVTDSHISAVSNVSNETNITKLSFGHIFIMGWAAIIRWTHKSNFPLKALNII